MTGAERELLRHFLGVLAYRMQKALRSAPSEFLDFPAGNGVRTPRELLEHMTGLMVYAASSLTETRRSFEEEDPVARFHEGLGHVSDALRDAELDSDTARRLLQGPLADAMTHVGQLAMLRRLAESPIAKESFYEADITAENTGPEQSIPGE
jgi:hypothetical protein